MLAAPRTPASGKESITVDRDNPWLVIAIEGRTHFIARAHVLDIVFCTEPLTESDHEGGQRPIEGTGHLVARITTTGSQDGRAYELRVQDKETATKLYEQLRQEAGLPSGEPFDVIVGDTIYRTIDGNSVSRPVSEFAALTEAEQDAWGRS